MIGSNFVNHCILGLQDVDFLINYEFYGFEKQSGAQFNQIIFKNSVPASKETLCDSVIKTKPLILFRKIIPVYSDNHTKHVNILYGVLQCSSRWYI